jgi:CHASE2 domain-containing sensor protein
MAARAASTDASFAEQVARAANRFHEPKSDYISWLRPPGKDIPTFQALSANRILFPPGEPLPLANMLAKKIVLIGINVPDRDQHITPFWVVGSERVPGVFIHAQILTQLLDPRYVRGFAEWMSAIAGIFFFILGLLVGRQKRLHGFHLWIDLLGVLLIVALSIVGFLASLIVPSMPLVIGWITGVAVGHQVASSSQNHTS